MSNRRQDSTFIIPKSLFPGRCQNLHHQPPSASTQTRRRRHGLGKSRVPGLQTRPAIACNPIITAHLPSLSFAMPQSCPLCLPTLLLWHAHISQSRSDRDHSGKPKLSGLLRRDGHTQSRDDPIHLPSGMTSVNCRRGHACPRMAVHVQAAWCRRLGAGSAWLAHPHTSRAVGCSRRFPSSFRGLDRAGTPRSDQVNKVNNYLSASLGFFSSAHSTPSRKESKANLHRGTTHSNQVYQSRE